MRSYHARGVVLALGLMCLAQGVRVADAQEFGEPSLLPIPSALPLDYPVSQTTAAVDSSWWADPTLPGATPANPPAPAGSIIAPELRTAPLPSTSGCTTCDDSACTSCCDTYIYGHGLFMTFDKRGGFVTSIETGTGNAELFFCDPEYGRIWHGGFEIGIGRCLGCGCQNAVEAVYWGLFAAPGSVYANDVDSMIDFTNLDYNGGSANDFFFGSDAHRLVFDRSLHSIEINILGNGCEGGPFGCGACGCCSPYDCGSRLGFGWLAGFRYINYTENWLFTGDNGDGDFTGGADELNYEVDLSNNLFGFQMGAGLNYCVTQRLSAYSIAKFGVYGNRYSHGQEVYGSADGGATLNAGIADGQVYGIDDDGFDVSFAGQFDLGTRWNMTQRWSLNLGYRLLALSGVAISEDNVSQGNFQNVLGIADTQKTGSLITHGGYMGVEYCW